MRTLLFLTLSFAFIHFTGCGGDSGRPADMPPIYPVRITITQNGAALADASVTLTAKTPAMYGVASGMTNASGTAMIRTYGFEGVPEGAYTVTVSKQAVEGAVKAGDNEGNEYETGGKVYEYVDTQYAKTDTSTLSIEVTTKGAAETFDVGTPVHVFLHDN